MSTSLTRTIFEILWRCTLNTRTTQPPRTFLHRRRKKGGGGILTPGVLFGDGEERKMYEHLADDYDAAKKQAKAELESHRSKLQEQQFKSMVYGNRAFISDAETYHHDEP